MKIWYNPDTGHYTYNEVEWASCSMEVLGNYSRDDLYYIRHDYDLVKGVKRVYFTKSLEDSEQLNFEFPISEDFIYRELLKQLDS